jgi:hypothetical protein
MGRLGAAIGALALLGTAWGLVAGDCAGAPADCEQFRAALREQPFITVTEASNGAAVIESVVHDTNETFEQALVAAGVEHQYLRLPCGVHLAKYFFQQFFAWLPTVDFAVPARAVFDYRSAAAHFSVDGWTVTADLGRAEEFIDLRQVTADGLTLTGTGQTTVLSPAGYEPGSVHRVAFDGVASDIAANGDGRLALPVDLGPPDKAVPQGAALLGARTVHVVIGWTAP